MVVIFVGPNNHEMYKYKKNIYDLNKNNKNFNWVLAPFGALILYL